MKKTVYLLLLFISLTIASYSQDLYIKSHPATNGQTSQIQIEDFSNGDYVIAGHTNAVLPDLGKLFVRKLNSCGNEIWSREISHNSFSLSLVELAIDSSENIILSGQYYTNNQDPKAYLIKMTETGSVLYAQKLTTSNNYNTLIYSTSVAPNGDYLMYCLYNYTTSPPNNQQMSICRIAPSGNVKWLKNYNFPSRSWGRLIATSDNGAFANTSNTLFKVDSLGNVEWTKQYNFLGEMTPPIETDSGYVYFRFSLGALNRASAISVRHDGSIAWFTNTFFNFYPNRGIRRQNGNVLFIGSEGTFLRQLNRINLLEINPSDGNIVRFELLQPDRTFGYDLTEDHEGNILFSGTDNSGIIQHIASGKINDTLSTRSCPNTTLPSPTDVSTFSLVSSNITPGVLNTDFTASTFTITVSQIAIQGNAPICEFKAPRGNYKLGRDTILCPKQSLLLGSSTSNYDSYLWSTGEQTKTITISSAGSYSVMLTAACDTLRDTIEVNYYPIIGLDLGRDTSICNGDSIELGKNLNFTNYTWSDGSTNPTLTVQQSGVYWLEVQTNCGPVRDSIELLILPPSNSPLLGNDTTICFGDSLTLNPGLLPNYNWSTGAQSPSITVLDSGLFWVESRNTCDTLRDSIQVNFFPRLNVQYQTSSLEAFVGDSITFESLTQNSLSTLWDFADGNTSTLDLVRHSFSQIGTYKVQLLQQSSDACIESIIITIVIKASDYYAPTIFSPNNDGINDFFFPVGKDIVNYEMEIFNRWGASIFESNNVAWNGKSNDHVRVDQGVYQYIISIELNNKKKAVLKGSISLVR